MKRRRPPRSFHPLPWNASSLTHEQFRPGRYSPAIESWLPIGTIILWLDQDFDLKIEGQMANDNGRSWGPRA